MKERLKKVFPAFALAVALVSPCPAYAVDAETSQFYTDVEAWFSTVNGHLGVIMADTSDIYSVTNSIYTWVGRIGNEIYNDFQGSTRTLRGYVSGIYSLLQTIGTNNGYLAYLDDIYSYAASIDTRLNSQYQKLDDIYLQAYGAYSSLVGIHNLLSQTINANLVQLGTVADAIYDQGETVIDYIISIRDLLKVPSSSSVETIVGDLDDVQFENDVDDLISTISTLAPFGAINIMSAEINVLSSVRPPSNPVMAWDFDFFGHETVNIDLSWLDDLRPVINFTTMFLLMYCLSIVSMKWIREEAAS